MFGIICTKEMMESFLSILNGIHVKEQARDVLWNIVIFEIFLNETHRLYPS
jgi:hypothetical protein